MTRTLVLALCALVLAGCQLYWMKPNADMSSFSADRGCLRERGWSRETGSSYANLPGYFRGLEDGGPVRVSDVPEQIPSRHLPGRSR
jgi:hypothetical protein